MSPAQATLIVLTILFGAAAGGGIASAQLMPPGSFTPPARAEFEATLTPATHTRLVGLVDSNSPAIWDEFDGRRLLFVLTSVNGHPSLTAGPSAQHLAPSGPVAFPEGAPPGGTWMEAVVRAEDGTWYGYYHNEMEDLVCVGSGKVIPRIGAARSTDQGHTWVDLGIVLEAPPDTERCETTNTYFVGGVGDFSVMLDHEQQYLYVFFTQYPDLRRTQGVAVARMAWAGRDEPQGRMDVWNQGAWMPPQLEDIFDPDTEAHVGTRWVHPLAMPIFRTIGSWHSDEGRVAALWGPSVHWNRDIEQYVMLLNRASDVGWTQEGIYVSFSSSLDDPRGWSLPERILEGGTWYPQVMGLEAGVGTDKLASAVARFYMGGHSNYLITFSKR